MKNFRTVKLIHNANVETARVKFKTQLTKETIFAV